MDIKINSESIDIDNTNLIIKEETKLIECDWLPTKFDDENYYQEFALGSSKNISHEVIVNNGSICEQFTIEYIDEGDDCQDDDYAESEKDDTSMKSDSDEEDNAFVEDNLDLEHHLAPKNFEELENAQAVGSTASSGSRVMYQLELNKWIAENYINLKCPECNECFQNGDELRRHITLNHKESIEDSESSRLVHTAKHSEDSTKFDTYSCKICSFNSKRFSVQKHILQKHPDIMSEFKCSGSLRNLKCPLCPNIYIRRRQLWYHFMDKHPREYKAKLKYNCHLCENVFFSEEKPFLTHLIEKHKLNSWRILNYRKVFEDKECFACKDCNRLFFQNDTCKLLGHFLNHENKFCWSCKFCCNKFYFKKLPVSHMCRKMMRYYEKHNEVVSNKSYKTPEKTELKIENLQEFEKHITHVCPFCSKEFVKMIKWQHHLRTDHGIDTLKGLEMKVITSDSNKLSCIICHTVVANSAEQLHAHRFQHLPYKPYKCLFCSKALSTFKIAVNHVSMRCRDEDVLVEKTDESRYDIRSILDIQCSFCNYQKFIDIRSAYRHFEDKHNCFEDFFIKHSDNSTNCKICHKKYLQYKKHSCFVHLRQHFDEKTFKCKLCLRSYPTFSSVSRHFSEVHNAKPLNKQSIETINDKTSSYLNKEDEKANVINLPQLAKSTIKSHVLNEFADFISYACPECNEGMTTQQNWHTHIKTQHNFFEESNLYIRRADGSLKCPTCSITINTNTLQKHKLTHMPYRSFVCSLCYTRCNSLEVLYRHFRVKHFALGIFKCPICSEVLQTEHQSVEHIKQIHRREEWPDNMCLICYKVLSTKWSLNKHMHTHKADRFRYTCDVCRSKILYLNDFNAHMDRHKMRSEIKEKIGDKITSQSSSKISRSNDADDNDQNETSEKFYNIPENLNKRKSFARSSPTKKKKN